MVVKKPAAESARRTPEHAPAPAAKKAPARRTGAEKTSRSPLPAVPAEAGEEHTGSTATTGPARRTGPRRRSDPATAPHPAGGTGTAARLAAGAAHGGVAPAGDDEAATSTTTHQATAAANDATAEQTEAKTVVAKKTVADAAGSDTSAFPAARAAAEGAPAEPGTLAVRPGEEPWTPDEVAEARTELDSEARRLRGEIKAAEEAISGLMRDSGDGAGDDQADVGTKNISREHEMALADNAREMLRQTEHAMERLHNGTYGLCESCGKPIGKARMQAFPRATLCVECKQRTERR
ncbi:MULTISPECIES: TraR/DksA family transcriptional regulator [Streptomycetaceae]|uniref:Putative DNA-binding protein n=1 Tax=Streptantibioticus cattleyicolor (strain ATCC 35852 / DSM 46488 / JCM 4925 / NBRC 14057 / NRRL 8057) TaxID=1003195 RepID=F8JZX5_STREN|nr:MULTISPECIES: TraR/DksA C4-type zinc finger protein [Streptomycetaceae]AEW93562.1 putative DNA-binding protein [Streptantibioticus cattleyicolor NRRL 8057 = DSM 46488]MYS58268.1 DNA-binding protein [Streptomyces sp. SID5468]CCB73911.1 putative DNA-binding protein [Streptantibioticus cattleyicolor NRRL 8057 = DSM 46488]